MKKTTITDVAKKVGMTTITVSRALNTPEKVKKETLTRILEAAKELNYVPNAIARNLKSKQSKIIGLVTASIDNPFYENTFKAVNRAAKQNGYSLMLFDTDGSEELEQKAIDTLISYQVSGIILSAVSDDRSYQPNYLSRLKLAKIPVAQIDRKIAGANFPGIYIDNFHSAYQGMKGLLSKGYNNILILAGPEYSQITIDRVNGIKQAAQDHTGGPIEYRIEFGDYTKEPSKETLIKVIHEKRLPDAIFGLNILISIGALEALQENGLSGDQFGLMSIDPIPYAKAFGKSIPCIKHDTYELGLSAIEFIIKQIESEEMVEDKIITGEYSLS